MTERKVLNKYYPPDFDPRKLPKLKAGEYTRKWVQRVMAPFNMKCNTCGEFIYQGKKFNMRRERANGEDYLGLAIWRFYFRCPKCLAEITFKTDLKNCDYAQEHGSTRLFEAGKKAREMEEVKLKIEEKEMQDPMKQLEKRTKMSRLEMDDLARLEELREINKLQAKPDFNTMLTTYKALEEAILEKQEEEDEKFVKAVFGEPSTSLAASPMSGSQGETAAQPKAIVKRLAEDEDDDDEVPISSVLPTKVPKLSSNGSTPVTTANKQKEILKASVKLKKMSQSTAVENRLEAESRNNKPSAIANLADYGSGSDTSDD